jgi:hypothetical protein
MLCSVQITITGVDLIYLQPDPNMVIYASTIASTADKEILARDYENNYGFFNLYPTVYPSIVPYPARYECRLDTTALRPPASARALPQSTNLSPLYPFFDLCMCIMTCRREQCFDSL